MKILTREHSLEMARIIAETEGEIVNSNELTIQDPQVFPTGQIEVYVLNIDSFKFYRFFLENDDNIYLREHGTQGE